MTYKITLPDVACLMIEDVPGFQARNPGTSPGLLYEQFYPAVPVGGQGLV